MAIDRIMVEVLMRAIAVEERHIKTSQLEIMRMTKVLNHLISTSDVSDQEIIELKLEPWMIEFQEDLNRRKSGV